MDELREFFNPASGRSRPIVLRGGLTEGMHINRTDTINQLNRTEDHRRTMVVTGTDYSRAAKERETALYLRNANQRDKCESMSTGLETLEQMSSIGDSIQNLQLTEEAMVEVYNKYSFQMKEDTNNLAINEFKQQILDRIKGFPVVIIEGPTGCGKTTQVPQWILDDCYQNRKHCKVIVTQPRRIAAISIAKRVAQERGWDVGGLVGYQVGLDNKTTNDTCIHYVTTGVLLQKLVGSKSMNEYTHIILDEVHERGQEMDFLLLVVRRLLYTVSPNVKVILMSATFNREAFAEYFMIPTPKGLQKSSCINVAKKEQMFTVKTFYINHLSKFGSILQLTTPKTEDPTILPEMHHLVIKLVNAFEQIDMQEDNYTDRSEADLSSILIFLPGINEIEDLFECLTDKNLRNKIAGPQCSQYHWWVLPLHSTITADEQVRVFQRAPPGHRKIILATNIAESSITVPDIKYVIDYCLMKVLVADENTNFTSLQLKWASKTNCEQRAGRAGRVRDGRVYRLVTDKFYETFAQDCPPEMIRCPLERLALIAKMLDMGPPSDVLALAMDPPDMSNIHRTILVLKEIGALKQTLDGEWCPIDGDITYLGRIMAKLPLDVKVSKLIMLGHIFGCLEESVIMAAAMSVKNIFSSPFRERLNAYNSKLTWADGSTSDCIAFYNVYRVWSHLRQQQFFRRQGNNEVQWARRFYVQVRSLREMDDLVREIKMRLSREGIEVSNGPSPWQSNEIILVHKVILAGAFYPQYFVQGSLDETREREAVRTLGGLDPRNTVYLKNFPSNQPGEVYARAIKNSLQHLIGEEPKVTFDKNSMKVYLTFDDDVSKKDKENNKGDPTIPGQVVLPIYKCLKMRQLRMDISIPLLPIEKANALAAVLQERNQHIDINTMVPRFPELDDTFFPLKISFMSSISKFCVQYDDQSTADDLAQIHGILNRNPLLAQTGDVSPGEIYAAPFVDGTVTAMYRAKVMRKLPREMVDILYIDFGNGARINVSNLRVLPAGKCRVIPPLAMRCSLEQIAPSPILEAHGQWSRGAVKLFQDLISKGKLLGKVYSVAHGVVSIELLVQDGKVSVNKMLLERNYAVPCEESYDSKLNHDLRQTRTELEMSQKRGFNKEQAEEAFDNLAEIDAPNTKDCISDVYLKGPFSPLETSLHNLMYGSREKQVQVEWNSVNSVILDTEPQAVYERMLVAGDVGQNETGSKLTLRHTTYMPNIPGLPAIMALLFCPVAELRRDEEGMRYVSTLCGLGSTEDGMPYFPEHDLLLNIDADLDNEDIGLINHIRHLMDFMMFCEDSEDIPGHNEDRAKVPGYIKKDLLSLLQKRRKPREPVTIPRAWEWKSVNEDDVLEIIQSDMVSRSVVYPLHSPLDLNPPSREHLLQLKRDNDHLKLMVARTSISSAVDLQCTLCKTAPMPTLAMRIHLYSNAHKEREEDLRLVQS